MIWIRTVDGMDLCVPEISSENLTELVLSMQHSLGWILPPSLTLADGRVVHLNPSNIVAIWEERVTDG